MMIATVSSIIVEAAKPWPRFCARNMIVVDVFRRHLRGDARAAAGLRDDEVVELDDAGGDDDERGDEDRAHHRDDDEEVGLPHRDAVDARGLPDVLVDAAQAGEHQAHDEPGALPEPGDQDAVDDDVGVVERVEGEALEAEAADDAAGRRTRGSGSTARPGR